MEMPQVIRFMMQLKQLFLQGKNIINYKHLCGEYPTAAEFAMWLVAVNIADKNGCRLYKQLI